MSPPDCDAAEIGAFSAAGPWRVDRDRLGWSAGLDRVRRAARDEVPALTRPARFPPLGRFLQAAWHLGRALAGWFVFERWRGGERSRTGLSRRLRRAFVALGPAYIKLGQIVSSGEGLFPDELVAEFKKLRDRVPAERFATVRGVVEADLGKPLEAIFADFDVEPLAAASIAQVHAATLLSGEAVVVKVQRPTVAARVKRDIAAMAWIAPWLVGRIPVAALANPPALVELFAETISEEVDFRLEAENMLDVARVLAEAGQSIIVVPRPHPELVTRRVLVMERLRGFHYDEVEAMLEAGIDTGRVLRELMTAFLEGAMIYGVFHGDLHGGNLFVMSDGRVALFDYGITARMTEEHRLAFLRMMMTAAMNDVRGQIAAFRDLGALPPDTDLEAIAKLVKVDRGSRDVIAMSGDQLVAEIREILRGLLAEGAKLPKNLMLYVKGMLFFDGAIAKLAPDLEMFAEVTKIYGYFVANHAGKILGDIGLDPEGMSLDLTALRMQLGVGDDVTSLTHRQLQERRELLRERLEEKRDELRRI